MTEQRPARTIDGLGPRPVLSGHHARARGASVGEHLVYAVGDIHGRYDLLLGLLKLLRKDAYSRAAARRPLLIFCGDYVDRGPESAKVIEALLWLQDRADYELRFLKGNHEQALLGFLEDPGTPWLEFGGLSTLRSYGLDVPGTGAVQDPRRLRDLFEATLPPAHLQFLRNLRLSATCGDFLFVHAGVRPGIPLRLQSENDLLWIRDEFLNSTRAFKRMIVHGHSWSSSEPEVRPHRIGLDTGAYQTGVLTALRIDGDELHFLRSCGHAGPERGIRDDDIPAPDMARSLTS